MESFTMMAYFLSSAKDEEMNLHYDCACTGQFGSAYYTIDHVSHVWAVPFMPLCLIGHCLFIYHIFQTSISLVIYLSIFVVVPFFHLLFAMMTVYLFRMLAKRFFSVFCVAFNLFINREQTYNYRLWRNLL